MGHKFQIVKVVFINGKLLTDLGLQEFCGQIIYAKSIGCVIDLEECNYRFHWSTGRDVRKRDSKSFKIRRIRQNEWWILIQNIREIVIYWNGVPSRSIICIQLYRSWNFAGCSNWHCQWIKWNNQYFVLVGTYKNLPDCTDIFHCECSGVISIPKLVNCATSKCKFESAVVNGIGKTCRSWSG